MAAALQRGGLQKGDRVAIVSANHVLYPVVFQGILLAGGVVTTLNPLYTVEEMRRQFDDCACRFVVGNLAALERIRQARADIEDPWIRCIDSEEFEALLCSDVSPEPVAIDPELDLAVLPYSSGTSGMPKGVMLTHANLVANAHQSLATFRSGRVETVLAVLPFFHIYGMGAILNVALLRGDAVVVVEKASPAELVGIIESHRVTQAYLVPPLALFLAQSPVVLQHDLSSLKDVVCAAAPLDAALSLACSQRLGCPVVQGYGMTEASPSISRDSGRYASPAPGSVGTLLPSTQLRVIDPETLEDLDGTHAGEFLVRGPQVMKGYLNRPEETRAAILPGGWLRTGDVGYVDAEGRLFLLDRLKEMIKYKAYQIAPSELEGVLLQHPTVRDVAVVPSPDTQNGEVPKAFVVRQPGATVVGEELMAYVSAQVAPYKKVRQIEFVDAIPKSASGKILRRALIASERQRSTAL